MRGLDFSSWQSMLSALAALAAITLIGVGIRLSRPARRSAVRSPAISRSIPPICATCAGAAFPPTAELVVSLRDFIRRVLDLEPVPADLSIPMQGPTRPSGGAKGKGESGGRDGQGGGGRGGGAIGAGGGAAAGIGVGGMLAGNDERTPAP